MKKILHTVIVLFSILSGVYSQDIPKNYIQGIVGTDFSNARYLKLEVGRKISFVDIGLGFSYSSNLPYKTSYGSVHIDNGNVFTERNINILDGKQYFSLMLNAKVNLLYFLFKQKTHQLYLGGSIGITDGLKLSQYIENDNKKIAMSIDRYVGYDNTFNLTYQYQLSDKYALGITAEMLSLPEYLMFGVSIKRFF